MKPNKQVIKDLETEDSELRIRIESVKNYITGWRMNTIRLAI